MKFKQFLLIGIMILSLLPAVSFGQDEGDAPYFAIDLQNPIAEHGKAFEWDGQFTNPGAVVYHDGLFHMFRPGFFRWGEDTGVGYLTSEDGGNWTEYSEDPIFTQDEVPFGIVAMPTSALVDDDGTWLMYFFLVPMNDEQPSGVVRATADQPQGPWIMGDEIVLELGSEGEWDSALIPAPEVLKIDGQYVMYFGGQRDTSGDTNIGMATSEDGIVWTKYDDPDTINHPFAESDSIILPLEDEDTWEYAGSVQAPRVVETPNGFVMLYSSFNGSISGGFRGYGLATSSDGITWERISDEPVFSTHQSEGRDTWFPELAYHGGNFFMYVSINDTVRGTNIYGGPLVGSLFE